MWGRFRGSRSYTIFFLSWRIPRWAVIPEMPYFRSTLGTIGRRQYNLCATSLTEARVRRTPTIVSLWNSGKTLRFSIVASSYRLCGCPDVLPAYPPRYGFVHCSEGWQLRVAQKLDISPLFSIQCTLQRRWRVSSDLAISCDRYCFEEPCSATRLCPIRKTNTDYSAYLSNIHYY